MSNLVKALEEVIQECGLLMATLDDSTNDSAKMDWVMNARIRSVRTALSDAKRIAEELHLEVAQRVYCIEVSTHVEQTIKVLARTEEDAISLALETAEGYIESTLGEKHDVNLWSEGYSYGDESPLDDDADVEFDYSGHDDGPEDNLHYTNER